MVYLVMCVVCLVKLCVRQAICSRDTEVRVSMHSKSKYVLFEDRTIVGQRALLSLFQSQRFLMFVLTT
jgi:hypothetical protein